MPRRKESGKAPERRRSGEISKGGEGSEAIPVSPLRRSRPAAARVSVIGAGRLGTALARALAACGYEIEFMVARTAASARRAAVRAGVEARTLAFARLEELPPSDILFITTPDDTLTDVAAHLASLSGVRGRARVALHTSGALSSDVLGPLRGRGFSVGSMHPLAAVSEAGAGAESLRRAFYCVEGDAAAVRAARGVVGDLGGESFSVRAEDKALYHAAAVVASGHSVALFDIATRLLARCGLSEAGARRTLLPLMRSTLENLSRQTPSRALTGTFARGDSETVRKHLAALKGAGESDALLLYALLGGRSLRLAAARGVRDPRRFSEIARLLAEALGLDKT